MRAPPALLSLLGLRRGLLAERTMMAARSVPTPTPRLHSADILLVLALQVAPAFQKLERVFLVGEANRSGLGKGAQCYLGRHPFPNRSMHCATREIGLESQCAHLGMCGLSLFNGRPPLSTSRLRRALRAFVLQPPRHEETVGVKDVVAEGTAVDEAMFCIQR